MSAVAGLFFRDGRSTEPVQLDRMLSPLAHRAPHGSWLWNEGPIGFGGALLKTSSVVVTGPIARSEEGGLVIVADARIDNRREILDSLDLRPNSSELTDEQVILRAYRTWGADAPRHLVGDFAFAIWDRDRQTILCARDPFGVRPFYYHLSDRVFAFASEIKALLTLPEVPRQLDEIQVAYYLDNFLDDPERTFYRGIRRLPAAFSIEVSPQRVRTDRHWQPEPAREVHYPTQDQYADAFREIFLEAVRCRLREADPVGAALSGGLDSSSVVRAARLLLPPTQAMHAFSAVFPGLPDAERSLGDESEYIKEVAAVDGIVSHRIAVDRISPLADYDRVMRHLDSPPLAFNLYVHWAMFEAAQREGIHVFLDGTDGDSVVSKGFERFIDLANDGRWTDMVREAQALTDRHGAVRSWFPNHLVYPQLLRLAQTGRWRSWWRGTREVARGLNRSRRKILLRSSVGTFLPQRIVGRYREWKANGDSWSPLIRKDFADRTRVAERERALLPNAWAHSAREDHARVLSLPRYQFAMELIGGEAAAFGIETRYPFFDRRLVEFCIAIPPEQKLADGWTRLIQRRGMEGILPPSVQWRMTKGNLGLGFARGMRGEASAMEPVLFDDSSSRLGDFVDLGVLRSTHARFLAADPGSDDANYDAMSLYKATVLARWLRDHGPDA
ncbi:MAG TPA: lasso peptide isopeptide bond-forming cyclase [Gemmatimonadota bacterium]|nr:lasso peptide isopeptide bond-forming cyclase [Gemmatimonadota bacterium]